MTTATATFIPTNDFTANISTLRESIGNALEYRGSATAYDNLSAAVATAKARLEAASDKRQRAASYLSTEESRSLDSTFRAADFTAVLLANAITYAETVLTDIRKGRKESRKGFLGWLARLVA